MDVGQKIQYLNAVLTVLNGSPEAFFRFVLSSLKIRLFWHFGNAGDRREAAGDSVFIIFPAKR